MNYKLKDENPDEYSKYISSKEYMEKALKIAEETNKIIEEEKKSKKNHVKNFIKFLKEI